MDELDKIIIQSDELKKKVRIRVKKKSGAVKASKGRNESQDLYLKKESKSYGKKSSEGKFLKLGSLTPKKGPSDFRKKSAQWRDLPKTQVNDIGAELEEKSFDDVYESESFFEKIREFTPIQWTAVAMAVVIFATSVMTTGVYAEYKGEQNKATAFAELPSYNDGADSELAFVREEVVEEVEPIAAEEPEEINGTVLSLILTSVEKDLKIKLVDDEDTLVKGITWGVTVSDSEGAESSYEDTEQDGIIHITDMSAGDYSVTINPSDSLEGYTIPSTAQQVSVKAKVEYKVIANIKDEIKSEKEVDAAAEDANGNQAADVETGTALTDTVEFVESTKTESGEEYIASSVDLSKCETAKATIKDYIINAIKAIAGNGTANSGTNLAAVRLMANCDDNAHSWDSGTYKSSNNDGTHVIEYKCTNSDCDATKDESVSCGVGEGETCSVCGYMKPSSTVKVTSISLSGDSSVTVGSSITLSASVSPDNATDKSYTWSSTDSSIATVSDGKVTGVKAGTVTIKATANDGSGVVGEKSITVNAATSSSVTLSGTSSVKVGSTTKITATLSPSTDSMSDWTIGDTSIATISKDGTSCTVTGVKAGTVTLTAKSSGASASMTITVTAADVKYKSTSQLYDSSGNKLYKKDGDTYTLATYADYEADSSRTFYKKSTGYIYTGWQTIDNKTYYYKADHTYVTGDQVIGGVTYHFGSDGALTQGSGTLGIDVSKYQPSINWSSVAASGISFVIIRCGYRGASTGALIQDPYFTSHIKGAKAAGLKVGVYFFSTALTEAEAVEEASMCAALCSGYGVNYPVFIDVESSSRAGYNSLSAAQRTANIKAFCSTIKSAGYTPGVYANKTWLTSYINTSQLSGYKIWLAQYNSSGPTYSGRYDLWQYTSKGSVGGISGNVDMNQSYLGY